MMGSYILLAILAAGIPVAFFNPTSLCDEPFGAVGPCEAYIPRWSYNQETDKCEKFIYGGCEGNKNRFESKQMCGDHCQTTDEEEADHELCIWADRDRCTTQLARRYCPVKCVLESIVTINVDKIQMEAIKIQINFTDSCSPNTAEKILNGTDVYGYDEGAEIYKFITHGPRPECRLNDIFAWDIKDPLRGCNLTDWPDWKVETFGVGLSGQPGEFCEIRT